MSVGVDQELEQRLLAAQRATQAAEEKIQKLIDLVKKAREEEESRVPYELRQRYQKARMRKKKAIEEIAVLKSAAEQAMSQTPKAWKPVKQGPVDERRALLFTKEGMKTQVAKEGLAARSAELPKLSVIPPFLLHAKQFLEVNGVVSKIFYKKGNDAAVQQLVARANDQSLDITQITDDPYTVAQAMLAYFHALPKAIIPENLVDEFAKVYGMDLNNQAVPNILHDAVNRIPHDELQILNHVFRYLSQLSEMHLETRMEAVDLADIWAPVLFRSNSRVNPATQAMMKYYTFIFAPKKTGRTMGIQSVKTQTSTQEYDSKGYEDNRFNYMARGYS